MLLLGANVEGHEHGVTPFDARVQKTTGGVDSSEKSDHIQVNSGGAATSLSTQCTRDSHYGKTAAPVQKGRSAFELGA